MAQQHSLVTVVGRNKHIAKVAANAAIIFTEIALGDGASYPSGGETALQNEIHRGLITGSGVEPGEPNAVWFDLFVPANVATFHAQEIGLFDEDGILYAVSRYETPVPKFGPDSSSLSDNTFRIVVVFSDTENIIISLSSISGLTPDNLQAHLPFATDPEFANTDTVGRIAQVKQIHDLIAALPSLALLQNNLVYPEIETLTATLAITDNADGTLTVDAGQAWLMRGLFRYSTDDFNLAARTVTTVASKEYHLRWTLADGFTLKDIADVAYNPSVLVEENAALDTTYDDMLIALIVTDGSNAATITHLKNKAHLHLSYSNVSAPTTSYLANGASRDVDILVQWARQPRVAASMSSFSMHSNGHSDHNDKSQTISELTRYLVRVHQMYDYTVNLGLTAELTA
ncbi:MAG: hypothetical protein COA78_33380 [Blastopirellula sp.]|nr:MAG: hypothetical protein COA78_33380 [Blastopirellula sp.]